MTHGLGSIRSQHRFKRSAFVMTLLMLPFVTLGGLFMCIAAVAVVESGMTPALRVASFLLGAGLLALAVLIVRVRLPELRRVIVLYDEGITYGSGNEPRKLRWSEVAELRVNKALVHNAQSLAQTPTAIYRLTLLDGSRFRVDQSFHDIEALGEAIEAGVSDALLPMMRDKLLRAERVNYGSLDLSPDGISKGRRELHFEDVAGVQVDQGRIRIFMRGEPGPFFDVAHASVFNARVLLHIIEEYQRSPMALEAKIGPLVLHRRMREREVRRAWLFGVLGALMSLSAFAYAGVLASRVDAVEGTWRRGTPALETKLLKLSTRREQIFFTVYIEVAYRTRDGVWRRTDAHFLRVLDEPQRNEPIEVRSDQNAPHRAVTSWERESFFHVVGFAVLMLGIAAFMATITVRGTRRSRRRMMQAEELARTGRLTRVRIQSTTRDERGFGITLRYRYETPRGNELEDEIPLREGGAYQLDRSGMTSLALLAYDERSGVLLTRSGYPLGRESLS